MFCLLTGFALLARHFEKSHLPVMLPKFLPHDWKGAFAMLALVWALSSFLDNIAAGGGADQSLPSGAIGRSVGAAWLVRSACLYHAFFVMLSVWPWHPDAPHKEDAVEIHSPR